MNCDASAIIAMVFAAATITDKRITSAFALVFFLIAFFK